MSDAARDPRRVWRLTPLLVALAAVAISSRAHAQELPRERMLELAREHLRSVGFDRPILRRQQKASLGMVYTGQQIVVAMPSDEEMARYREIRARFDDKALTYLDDLYGGRDELKALAFRDSDNDTVPDFRVSDFYGKFMEGDVDVDSDGIRNLYDREPFDKSRGGRDLDGDGIPDEGFDDDNDNGLPDFIDWSTFETGSNAELDAIQLGLFRDHKILLVERNASFDVPLARAVDDTVRRVFRAYFEDNRVMPTLRTVATEKTALLNERLARAAEDDTSAQVFSQTQSLIVYDTGREVERDIGLLGLVVHETGHLYHMALDYDVSDLVGENGRIDFPAPSFVELLEPFGWTMSDYDRGEIGARLPVMPRFVYVGTSEPVFVFHDEEPDAWVEWINEIYAELDDSPTYLLHEEIAHYGIVSDYSLNSPYEWYGDNFIAYVVSVIEEEALESISAEMETAAKLEVDDALRTIWPGFYHRNLAPDVRAYFESTFPISQSDRRVLAKRYIDPILASN